MDLKPDSFVCSSLLNACAILSAEKQIHVHAFKFGFMFDVFVGNSLVNMYAKCGSIEEADRAFYEIPERGVVSWSAMIGGLAQHGQEVIRLIKDSKVKKEPGISWIEVKYKIYTFIVGDRSHSRSEEIYAKLEELGHLMAKAEYVPMIEIEREKMNFFSRMCEKLVVAFALIAMSFFSRTTRSSYSCQKEPPNIFRLPYSVQVHL
ncbi:putative pentatricopeptide repeat-containing protein [Forsythia ovata]|uniref:Pentatricopeptide repeat-containing protein n=1 Tax=Forsythia ovata TaxID=205694 RepID=A0ABD1X674_9LAMI